MSFPSNGENLSMAKSRLFFALFVAFSSAIYCQKETDEKSNYEREPIKERVCEDYNKYKETRKSTREIFSILKERLKTVRNGKERERISNCGGDIPVDSLMGISRNKFVEVLGFPIFCEKEPSNFVLSARDKESCFDDSKWVYSFIHLPTGWAGGGPELQLNFNKEGICIAAQWIHTQ